MVQDERGKNMQTDSRSGGDAGEPEGRVLRRETASIAPTIGIVLDSQHSRGVIAYILSKTISQLVDTLMARL